jgi:hypothetical protein
LRRNNNGKWDSKQRGGYAAFVDMNFGASNEIQKVNGKYYMTYIGGKNDGYETDPLHMGLAYSDNPIDVNGFKPPNTLGKDIFSIDIFENGIKPKGITGDGYECNNMGWGCSAKYLMQ